MIHDGDDDMMMMMMMMMNDDDDDDDDDDDRVFVDCETHTHKRRGQKRRISCVA